MVAGQHAVVATVKARALQSVAVGGAHNGPNAGIHSGRIAPRGQYADVLHGCLIFVTVKSSSAAPAVTGTLRW